MNNSTIVFLINDQVRALEVEYEPEGSLTIVKTLDQTIEEGDLVVVQSETRHLMTVSKVRSADIDLDYDTSANIKWVVQKVDQSQFNGVLDQEREAINAVQSAEKKRKRDQLRESLFNNQSEEMKKLQLTSQTVIDEEAKK